MGSGYDPQVSKIFISKTQLTLLDIHQSYFKILAPSIIC